MADIFLLTVEPNIEHYGLKSYIGRIEIKFYEEPTKEEVLEKIDTDVKCAKFYKGNDVKNNEERTIYQKAIFEMIEKYGIPVSKCWTGVSSAKMSGKEGYIKLSREKVSKKVSKRKANEYTEEETKEVKNG